MSSPQREGGCAARPQTPLLSVVVPAWNEAERIAQCLEQLSLRLEHLEPEIIVVDDGSTDGTAGLCARWLAQRPALDALLVSIPHRGKGAAVHAGARASHGRVVAYIDADMDIGAEEIDHLLAERRRLDLDVVVGSKRRLAWRHIGRPLGRRVLSVLFSRVVRLLFRLPVQDTQTGVKLFGGAWLRAIVRQTRVSGFLFDLELLAAANAAGLRIGEVPVAVGMSRPASRIGPAAVARCALELAGVIASVARLRRVLRDAPGGASRVLPRAGLGLRHAGSRHSRATAS